jgi:hypothetical protein
VALQGVVRCSNSDDTNAALSGCISAKPDIKWEKSIAHWIPQDPTFVWASDASQVAGGAMVL